MINIGSLQLRCASPIYTPLGDTIYIWNIEDTNFNALRWYQYGKSMSDGFIKAIPSKISAVNINYSYTQEDKNVYNNTVTVNISRGYEEIPIELTKFNKFVVCFRQDNKYLFIGCDYGLSCSLQGSNGTDGTATYTFTGLSRFTSISVDKEYIGYFYLNASEDKSVLYNDEYKPETYWRVLEDENYTMDVAGENGVYNCYAIRVRESQAGMPLDKDGYPATYGVMQAARTIRGYQGDKPTYYDYDEPFDYDETFEGVAGNAVNKYTRNVSIDINGKVTSDKPVYVTDANVITDKLVYNNENIKITGNMLANNFNIVSLTDYTGNGDYIFEQENNYIFSNTVSVPYSDKTTELRFIIKTNWKASELSINEIDLTLDNPSLEDYADGLVLFKSGQLTQDYNLYSPGDSIVIAEINDPDGTIINIIVELY